MVAVMQYVQSTASQTK